MHQKDGAPDTPARCGKASPRRPSPFFALQTPQAKAAINASTWLSHAMRSALACVAAFLWAASSGRGSEGLGGGFPLRAGAQEALSFCRACSLGELPERDAGSNRRVERVDVVEHGNAHRVVAGVNRRIA